MSTVVYTENKLCEILTLDQFHDGYWNLILGHNDILSIIYHFIMILLGKFKFYT